MLLFMTKTAHAAIIRIRLGEVRMKIGQHSWTRRRAHVQSDY